MKIDGTVTRIEIPHHPLILRYSSAADDTLGLLYVNGVFQHYIIEDEYRAVKVAGETRMPAGIYKLALRTEGGFHEKYKNHKDARIRAMHKGMIWITEVPDFTYTLYHIMNTEKDTKGCVGGGDEVNNNQIDKGFTGHSLEAYVRTYPLLLKYVQEAKAPVMQIVDLW